MSRPAWCSNFQCLISRISILFYSHITKTYTKLPFSFTFICSCRIPECDIDGNNRNVPFDQPWLQNAIPFIQNKIDRCHRYAPRNGTSVVTNDRCDADMFDKTKLIECSEYVYASDERNVQTEVLLGAHTMDIFMKMLQLHF